MIVTVFRSRLNPQLDNGSAQDENDYSQMASRMNELAKTMPGYISHKSFSADDGERVTIVEFESMEGQKEWRRNAEHAQAMRAGKERFYSEYKIQVCEVIRQNSSGQSA